MSGKLDQFLCLRSTGSRHHKSWENARERTEMTQFSRTRPSATIRKGKQSLPGAESLNFAYCALRCGHKETLTLIYYNWDFFGALRCVADIWKRRLRADDDDDDSEGKDMIISTVRVAGANNWTLLGETTPVRHSDSACFL